MKTLMIGAAGFALLLLPATSYAGGHQKTGNQTSFQNNVKALPSTPKRRAIIRSESGSPSGHSSTSGMGPSR
jgi:hypothetical protein